MTDPLSEHVEQRIEPVAEPRSLWTVRDLLLFLTFFAVSILITPSFLPQPLSATSTVLAQGALDFAWVGFIFLLVKVFHKGSFREAIHWFHDYPFQAGFLVAVGATLAVGVLVVSSLFPPAEPPPIEKLLEAGPSLYIFLGLAVIIAPLFEEIIFRGFIFNVVTDLASSRVAVPLTAALFALLHAAQLWGSWAAIVLIFVMGYVLSEVRQRSNSLIPSFIIHTSYNGMIFLLATVGTLAQRGNPPS